MYSLIEIIGISSLAIIIATVMTPQLPSKLRIKPLTCESCIAFHIALGYFFNTWHIACIIPASLCYILAYKLYRL
jgi:hypothetical protein